jgi:hypothetical protein
MTAETTYRWRHPITGQTAMVPALAEHLPNFDADGFVVSFRPDYSAPGMIERVAREAFDDAEAANPPRSNVGQIMATARRVRFERDLAAKYGKAAR